MLLIMAFSLSLTLAACGDDSSGDSKIVLSYADWGSAEMNQALIDVYEEKNPNVEVNLRKDITGTGGDFTANLLNAQQAGALPDVFAIDNVPTGYSNGMLLDISEYWDADPDTEAIYPNIKETAVYGEGRYAVPSFQFIKGIMLNLNIFEEYNITVPDKDWTYDEFVQIAKEIRQAGKSDIVYGIDPWYGDLDFAAIWPTQDFEDVGYQTWDGEQFNFTSDAWIEAFEARNDLMSQDVVAGFTEEEMEVLGDVWPWYNGNIGMRIDATFNLWMVEGMREENGIEVGFWPYPGGDAGQFPPTILDYQVVSSQTDHPEEAYKLAKFMTFGKEGWMTRLDLMEATHEDDDPDNDAVMLDRFPVANYPEVWDRTSDYMLYVEGLQQSVNLLEYSKPDVDKWLPGYKAFWEWVSSEENDYWTKINDGEVSPAGFAPEWESKANELVNEALED